MSAPTTERAPAGWYPDPTTAGRERWWNGQNWTQDVRSTLEAYPAPAPPARIPTPSGGVAASPGIALKNTPATVGLIFGIASLFLVPFTCIVGLVLGIRGLTKSKESARTGQGDAGRKRATWAVLLSSIGALFFLAIIISAVSSPDVRSGFDEGVAQGEAAASRKESGDTTAQEPEAVPPAAPSDLPATGQDEPAREVEQSFVMPLLVGANLQSAQDELQSLGSYLLDQNDAMGWGRVQALDSNWRVCEQNPAAGSSVPVNEVVRLDAVKLYEECP